MYRKSLMNKESVLIKLGRILRVKTLNFSKWHVDGPIEIPIHQKLAVVPCFRNAPARRCKTVKRRAAFFALALALLAAVSVKASQSVSLAWNASSGMAGYIVYAGNSPGNYGSQMNVGTNTTVTITGLAPGRTNYFAVASYNSANLVGSPSSAVSYIVPGILQLSRVAGSTAPMLTFPTAIGHYYIVQASTNFVTWANIYESSTATANTWATFQDNTSGSFRSRFYRLVMH
jgi:Fibronectin type III domain